MMISTAKLLHAVQLSNQVALSLSKLGNHIEWKKFAVLTLTSSNEFVIPRKSWAQKFEEKFDMTESKNWWSWREHGI